MSSIPQKELVLLFIGLLITERNGQRQAALWFLNQAITTRRQHVLWASQLKVEFTQEMGHDDERLRPVNAKRKKRGEATA